MKVGNVLWNVKVNVGFEFFSVSFSHQRGSIYIVGRMVGPQQIYAWIAPSGPPSHTSWGVVMATISHSAFFRRLQVLSFFNQLYIQLIEKALLPSLPTPSLRHCVLLLSPGHSTSEFSQEPVSLYSNSLLSKAGSFISPNLTPL